MRPRLLDLFCGEGGASVGYAVAGFDVTGIDSARSCGKRYPFTFVAADAVEYVKEHGHEYDAIHASPPCQRWTHALVSNPERAAAHPDFITPAREALRASGLPYVIENVPRSPLEAPLVLCGSMFDMAALDDHRHFESNVPLTPPGLCRHRKDQQVGGVYGGGRNDKTEAREIRHGGYVPRAHVRAALLGINWMTQEGLSQSIPPVYTAYIGRQLLAATEAHS